ncbi:MAG: VCBS repeat-containing protein [Planctomycetota bacterium]|nr:VCBS repeat-containing protein [Planctomycetota bacterium]
MRRLTALALATCCSAQEPQVSYVQFPERSIHDVVLADADGDGAGDLVVSLRAGKDSGREIVWCFRRDGEPAFRAPADRRLPLPRDVVAFAIADVDPSPGAELVLLSPTRVVAVVWPRDAERASYRSLGTFDLLWQPPSTSYAFAFQEGVADLDGDGLDDLVLPRVGGYGIFVQRRDDAGTTFVQSILELPAAVATDRDRNLARFQAQRGSGEIRFGDSGQPQFLVELTHEVGAPRLVDWNADGRRDVVALVGARLAVFEQAASGRFAAAPSAVVELPERGMPLFDPSSFADCVDLDADGHAEFVRASGRTDEDEVRSVLEVHRGRGGDELPGEADEKLLLQGFVSAPRFSDVDGDGVRDLVIGSLRTDLVDALAGGGSKAFDAQINVFLGRGGEDALRFRRPVALVHRVQVPTDGLRAADRALIEFVADFDGDGIRDLFLRLGDGVLQVLPVTRRGRGLAVGEPVWSLASRPEARVSVRRTAAGTVLLLEESDQVVVVEGFR